MLSDDFQKTLPSPFIERFSFNWFPVDKVAVNITIPRQFSYLFPNVADGWTRSQCRESIKVNKNGSYLYIRVRDSFKPSIDSPSVGKRTLEPIFINRKKRTCRNYVHILCLQCVLLRKEWLMSTTEEEISMELSRILSRFCRIRQISAQFINQRKANIIEKVLTKSKHLVFDELNLFEMHFELEHR